MTDQATCGYFLAFAGRCRKPRFAKRCTEHNSPRFSMCDGCGQDAIGECAALNTAELSSGHPCRKPVCENCGHRADDTHGVDDSPFAAQRPGSKVSGQARDGLTASVRTTLDRAERMGMLTLVGPDRDRTRDRLASLIIDEVTADVFAKMLAGLATGQVSG